MRERVLLQGNCQGAWLTSILNRDAEINSRYEIVYLPNFGEIPANHAIHSPDFLAGCRCFLFQTAPGLGLPDFSNQLPNHCRWIRFPTLWLKFLWPLSSVDPRNKPELGHPFGRYPYGDRLAVKLLQDGVPASDLAKRYIDTNLDSIINLDRYAEMCLAELKHLDQQSDIALADYIEKSFRSQRHFGATNHPTLLPLSHLFHLVKAALLNTTPSLNDPRPPNAADVLGFEEIPLHPQVIRHFGLTWATPEMRYRYRSAFLTLEEYMFAYAEFAAIPFGEPPRLWIGRALQAVQQNQPEEARRLLREGERCHPGLPTELLPEEKAQLSSYLLAAPTPPVPAPGICQRRGAAILYDHGIHRLDNAQWLEAVASFDVLFPPEMTTAILSFTLRCGSMESYGGAVRTTVWVENELVGKMTFAKDNQAENLRVPVQARGKKARVRILTDRHCRTTDDNRLLTLQLSDLFAREDEAAPTKLPAAAKWPAGNLPTLETVAA
jgi:hypothetical protein